MEDQLRSLWHGANPKPHFPGRRISLVQHRFRLHGPCAVSNSYSEHLRMMRSVLGSCGKTCDFARCALSTPMTGKLTGSAVALTPFTSLVQNMRSLCVKMVPQGTVPTALLWTEKDRWHRKHGHDAHDLAHAEGMTSSTLHHCHNWNLV